MFCEGGAPSLEDYRLSRLLIVIFPPENYLAFELS